MLTATGKRPQQQQQHQRQLAVTTGGSLVGGLPAVLNAAPKYTSSGRRGASSVAVGPSGKSTLFPVPLMNSDNDKLNVAPPRLGSGVHESAPRSSSLRVLSVTVRSMREWNRYKERFLFHFELIGLVDSAVSCSRDDHSAKFFNFKDSTGVVKCVFYQIDRPLPGVIRGQCYRVVGSLNNDDNLQLYAIRPASNDEKNNFSKLVAISTRQMRTTILTI